MRKKLYGFNYRLLNKTIHRFDFCRLKYNSALAEKDQLGFGWIVPGHCDWCGSRNNFLVGEESFKKIQKKDQRYRAKIHKLFG